MEHLAVDCPLSLDEFCTVMQERFALPDFEFDCENETEWGIAERDGIEFNVSRPYERGTLEEWDGSVPAGCNFGVSLIVLHENEDPEDATQKSLIWCSKWGKGWPMHLGKEFITIGHRLERART